MVWIFCLVKWSYLPILVSMAYQYWVVWVYTAKLEQKYFCSWLPHEGKNALCSQMSAHLSCAPRPHVERPPVSVVKLLVSVFWRLEVITLKNFHRISCWVIGNCGGLEGVKQSVVTHNVPEALSVNSQSFYSLFFHRGHVFSHSKTGWSLF